MLRFSSMMAHQAASVFTILALLPLLILAHARKR